MQPSTLPNPFPGLRPFEPDEDHLFFGREKEIDELLRRLRSNRFLSVVGTSGSGKSSLVRSGLIPSLYSGFMVKAGSSWRVSILRPGEDPIGHLAEALDAPDVIGTTNGELAGTNRVLVEATLRRGSLGLVEAVRQARIPPDDNVLVVVDQFEELFRFRRSRQIENSRDEAVAFVKLLLESLKQDGTPIYIALTMRADFIGDCMEFPGLPEAVNEGQYLVPRMTRDELRSAITGPVAVGGATIAPRLVLRLLNDVGDDQDQLPVLQHALMRTWDYWARHRRTDEPIDIADYEAVGTLKHALSLHAEEAYQETGSESNRALTERVFKALTDTFSDPRGVRRPTSIEELAAICEAPESAVIQIVEIFRRAGRSFLMPPADVPLTSRTIVDLSHESLMRCWTRLIGWAEEERLSAIQYVRLSREASWFDEGAAGLWGDPELELGLRWRRENRPTAAWARRYDEAFERAMQFLDRSEKERDRLKAERAAERRKKLVRARVAAALFATLFVVAGVLAYIAERESTRAGRNLQLARRAVDETLAVIETNPAQVGADMPQIVEFRRELLGRAKRFYVEFIKQEPLNEQILQEMASGHFMLGQINRLLDDRDQATSEYRQAIAQFEKLARDHAGKPEYRQALANCYNWLGETLRSSGNASALQEYERALKLQTELVRQDAEQMTYRQELARTHYNRGIWYSGQAAPNDAAFKQGESDFREAIRLLEPLARQPQPQQHIGPLPAQELARVYNNLANLLAEDDRQVSEARAFYERAIDAHEELTKADPRNREYKLELAKFYDNLAELLREQGEFGLAKQRNERALDLIDELATPAPSLGVEQADGHNLRGRILQSEGSRDAAGEYLKALEIYESLLVKSQGAGHLPAELHQRFGDLLSNLAAWCKEAPELQGNRRLLSQAIGDYLTLGRTAMASASRADAQSVLENLSHLLPELPEAERGRVSEAIHQLKQQLRDQGATRK